MLKQHDTESERRTVAPDGRPYAGAARLAA